MRIKASMSIKFINFSSIRHIIASPKKIMLIKSILGVKDEMDNDNDINLDFFIKPEKAKIRPKMVSEILSIFKTKLIKFYENVSENNLDVFNEILDFCNDENSSQRFKDYFGMLTITQENIEFFRKFFYYSFDEIKSENLIKDLSVIFSNINKSKPFPQVPQVLITKSLTIKQAFELEEKFNGLNEAQIENFMTFAKSKKRRLKALVDFGNFLNPEFDYTPENLKELITKTDELMKDYVFDLYQTSIFKPKKPTGKSVVEFFKNLLPKHN
jgi:hypothetical protein